MIVAEAPLAELAAVDLRELVVEADQRAAGSIGQPVRLGAEDDDHATGNAQERRERGEAEKDTAHQQLPDAAGDVVAAAAVEPVRPHPGWSEQNPADWWTACLAAIDTLKASHAAELASVRGIGLSGHMHGAVLLGKDDEVLRPAILWNDGRSAAECREMEAALPSLRQISGNIAAPGFTAPKIAWVRKHEPAIFDKIAKVLLPKAYVRLLLTGEHVEDMSDAAGTLWLDVARRDWSEQLLALTENATMLQATAGSRRSPTPKCGGSKRARAM